MGKNGANGGRSLNFTTMSRGDVPQGRKGKHHSLVAKVLSDMERLRPGEALKIPLGELGDGLANVRSAINRAMHRDRLNFSTAADEKFLYVWNVDEAALPRGRADS